MIPKQIKYRDRFLNKTDYPDSLENIHTLLCTFTSFMIFIIYIYVYIIHHLMYIMLLMTNGAFMYT